MLYFVACVGLEPHSVGIKISRVLWITAHKRRSGLVDEHQDEHLCVDDLLI